MCTTTTGQTGTEADPGKKRSMPPSLLLDQGVEVNVLTVVNDYSVQFPEEIYAFHKAHGLNFMQFIPCVETDRQDPARVASFSVSAEGYGRFLCKLFDLWAG